MKLTLLVLALLAGVSSVDEANFRFERQVGTFAAGPVAFEPDGLLLAHAKPGFADLRVLDARGEQVPWRLMPQVDETVQAAQLLNSGTRNGRAVALLDLGRSPRVYDRIELQTPDRGFVGRVTVLGADRRAGPFTRLAATAIYDIRGAERARSTAVVLPPSDFRFLQVQATGVRRLRGAAVSGAAERRRLTKRPHTLIESPGRESRRSVFLLDLGVPEVPVTDLAIFLAPRRLAQQTYDRPVLVEGSNTTNGFRQLARGRISRFAGSSSPFIELFSRFRYLRVTIENGDDPPLRGVRLDLYGPSQAILLEPGHEPPFRLLYGGPEVRAPSYEFARIPPPDPGTFASGQLGAERQNESFQAPADKRSFVARNPELIQGALAIVALTLLVGGFLALRRRA